MLRIYPVCLAMVGDVRVLADRVAKRDRDHARQLRRASMSVAMNVGEGAGPSDGRRRARYGDALGSAREVLVGLECAEAAGYIRSIDPEVRNRLNHIIGALVKLLY